MHHIPFTLGPFTLGGLVLSLVVYVWIVMRVGHARGKYGVEAPAVSGAPEFERALRGQQNTVEQMVLFLPLLGLAGFLWGDIAAGLYGLAWSIGRVLYVEGYIRDPAKRSLGFLLSGGVSMIVLIAVIVTFGLRHFGIG